MECKKAVYDRFTYNRESATCKLELGGVQEVSWDKGGTLKQGIIFLYGKERESHQL